VNVNNLSTYITASRLSRSCTLVATGFHVPSSTQTNSLWTKCQTFKPEFLLTIIYRSERQTHLHCSCC